jgi:hypothetical protein
MKGRAPPRSLRIARKGSVLSIGKQRQPDRQAMGFPPPVPNFRSVAVRPSLSVPVSPPGASSCWRARRAQKEGSAGGGSEHSLPLQPCGGRPPASSAAALTRGSAAAADAAAAAPAQLCRCPGRGPAAAPPSSAPRGTEKSALGTAARARGSSQKEARRGGRRPQAPRPPSFLLSRGARGASKGDSGWHGNAGSFYR